MSCRKDLGSSLAALQYRAGGAHGKLYWRTLEELADTEAFGELIHREFPAQASIWTDRVSRRHFLSLMGASLALAGVSGCSVRPAPSGDIVPYVRAPEELVSGKPLFYATTMALGGTAVGLLVESHEGRPTKIEGNPDHPASRGATDIFSQASVLSLYDPDRSQVVTHLGQTRSWDDALAALRAALDNQRLRSGAGLRVLSEPIASPTLAAQRDALLRAFPQAQWHFYEPVHRDTAYRGAQLAFGQDVVARYDFSQADTIVALDEDCLASTPANLRAIADFAARRKIRTTADEAKSAHMNRLYVLEPSVTTTGAKADHRFALQARQIAGAARAIAAELGIAPPDEPAATHEPWVAALARDLAAHRGSSLVLAGRQQPPIVHLLSHAMNDHLGNVGQTVMYAAPRVARTEDDTQSLSRLVDEMGQDRVELLLILGGNPAYAAPVGLGFAERLERVPLRFHLSQYDDETSRLCHWHLPQAHYLECWSDAWADDGTASIAQPLIEPLYQGRSAHEVLAVMTGGQETSGQQLVREHWRSQWREQNPGTDFDNFWRTALHHGVVPGTQSPPQSVTLMADWQRHLSPPEIAAESAAAKTHSLEIVFQPDPTIYDGSFANNGWLQELPKPITKLTWGNAALVSPATAKRLGASTGRYASGGEHGGSQAEVWELRLNGRAVRAPLWIVPGQADDSITVHLGYGRTRAGRVGGGTENPLGFSAYSLRTTDNPWFDSGLEIVKTSESQLVACTQAHHLMENRDLARAGTLAQYQEDPRFARRPDNEHAKDETISGRALPTLYEPYDYDPPKHKWGMVIDLGSCVGCNACIVACQAENNIPVVGKQQVAAGREMHWLRVDRYIGGSAEAPSEFHFQPLPCMHCENAPCEYVCPVEATVHSAEGLNEMVYNRCVGTRFCSNNCPYKVRRFNFLAYADFHTPTVRMQYNPDVTVRSRGVMEKCTYCVQRIRHAEIDADTQQRQLVDGEILTACQAACPAEAIVFGDLNDSRSKVRAWKDSPLEYALLTELNTAPRTSYLAAVRNPNPELEAG